MSPASAGGRALRRLPPVTAELRRLGAPYRVIETAGLAHASEEAAAATATGETVAALGGDGLVRPIAGALRDSSNALAIVPGGRGNDLARVLGIPSDPVEAARVAVQGRERLLDVAEVDGVPYVGIASYGFDSVANRIANEARLVRGNLVYLYAALRALVTWRHARFSVTVDGEQHEFTGWSVAVANSKAYGGGMFLAPQAELDDGLLDVVLFERTSKLTAVRQLPRIFKGRHLDLPQVHCYRGEVVTLHAERPFTVWADGDPVAELPVTVRVRRRCLRVIVP